MGNLVIKIDMNGAAFEDETELPRILNLIAFQYVQGNRGKGILDSNGNRVGQWTIEQDDNI
jgi:hypothetical protein